MGDVKQVKCLLPQVGIVGMFSDDESQLVSSYKLKWGVTLTRCMDNILRDLRALFNSSQTENV